MSHSEHDYDAVIFDLGGVVFPSPFEAFDAYDGANDLTPGTVRALIKTSSETGAWAQLERGELTRHHRLVRALSLQEAAHQRGHLVVFPERGVDPLQEPAEGSGELASLLVWRLIGHGLDPRLSLSNPHGAT